MALPGELQQGFAFCDLQQSVSKWRFPVNYSHSTPLEEFGFSVSKWRFPVNYSSPLRPAQTGESVSKWRFPVNYSEVSAACKAIAVYPSGAS